MRVITANRARAEIYRLMDQIADSHDPICIKGKRGKAILVSEDHWRGINETLHLHSKTGMSRSIKEGLATPLVDCDPEPGW